MRESRRLPTLLPVDPSTGPRLAGIQGLRALAAVCILSWHVWLRSSPDAKAFDLGFFSRYVVPQLALGVTLLLLLSGFLLYRPFAAAIIAGGHRPSLVRYLVNRAFRILPAYWAILLVTVFVFQTSLLHVNGQLVPGRLNDPVELFLNLFLLQGFLPGTVLTGIGPAWALSAVVTFYAVLPLLVLLAAALASRATSGRGRVVAALVPAAVLVLIGLAGKLTAAFLVPVGNAGGWGFDWHTVVERGFLGHADMFGFGLAVAVMHTLWSSGRLRLPRWWRFAAIALMLAVALPATRFLATEADISARPLSNYAYDTLLAAAGGLFLAVVLMPDLAASRPSRIIGFLERRPIVAVGVVSYSLFLWHEPLILLLREDGLTLGGTGGFLVNELVVGGLALVLSILTYHYLERPALIRKSRRPPVRAAALAAPAGR